MLLFLMFDERRSLDLQRATFAAVIEDYPDGVVGDYGRTIMDEHGPSWTIMDHHSSSKTVNAGAAV